MSRQLVGTTLAGYHIEERLWHGSTASVYRATQLSVARSVALKLLHPELCCDKQAVESFIAAARSAGKLNHRCLVQVHEVWQYDGLVFYSMEHITGGSLAWLPGGRRTLGWIEVFPLLRDAAHALRYAERRGVIHGGIVPRRLLLTHLGRLKLLNTGFFGPPWLSQDPGPQLQDLVYAAPERLRPGVFGHAADIYSLGCVFYHVLAGRAPFSSSSAAQLEAEKNLEPPSLHDLAPEVPAWAASLVEAMMSPDQRWRPRSFGELSRLLRAGLVPPTSVDRKASRGHRTPTRPLAPRIAPAARSRRRTLVAAVTLLCILAAILWVSRAAQEPAVESNAILESSQASGPAVVMPEGTEDRWRAGDLNNPKDPVAVRNVVAETELEAARGLLAQGQYRDAEASLERLRREMPGIALAVSQELEGVTKAAARAFAAVESRAEELVSRGAHNEAESAVQALLPRVPRSLEEQGEALLQRIAERGRHAHALEQVEASLRMSLCRLELEQVETLLGSLPPPPTGTPQAEGIGVRAAIEKDVTRCLETWNKLESACPSSLDAIKKVFLERMPPTDHREFFRLWRAGLKSAAIHAMGKQILREGYASLFHGRMRILGETVEITYEFSDSRELEDFTPVENGGDVRLAAEDGEFVLQGECRFLRGEPFQDRLEVRLEVSSFPLEAPNINIGLWTKEGDVLGLVLRRGAEDALPAEAFGAAPLTNLRASCILFGLGYAPVDPLTASLGCAGPDQRLLFPCRAILTCSRAGDLRRPSSWRCQWGENLSTLKPMRPPQHVLAAHGPGGLEWSTGGWKLDAADSLRVLESMDAGVRKGSLTLFTNGGVLRCKSLAIVGALAPEWLDTQAEERARRNLGSMLPELDWEEEGR